MLDLKCDLQSSGKQTVNSPSRNYLPFYKIAIIPIKKKHDRKYTACWHLFPKRGYERIAKTTPYSNAIGLSEYFPEYGT